MRWSGGLAAAVALLLVTACGDSSSGTTLPELRELALERSGGIDGRTQQWILTEDGTLIVPATDVVETLDGDAAIALFDRIEAAGFFDLEPEYLPDDRCCDRFEYKLTLVAGGRRHTVATVDGTATAPRALFDLLFEVLAFVGG